MTEFHKALDYLDIKSDEMRATARPTKGQVKAFCDLADKVFIAFYKETADGKTIARK